MSQPERMELYLARMHGFYDGSGVRCMRTLSTEELRQAYAKGYEDGFHARVEYAATCAKDIGLEPDQVEVAIGIHRASYAMRDAEAISPQGIDSKPKELPRSALRRSPCLGVEPRSRQSPAPQLKCTARPCSRPSTATR
jgi:hypothetical protein